MKWNKIGRLASIAILVIGFLLMNGASDPPTVASPVNDGGFTGKLDPTIMGTQNEARLGGLDDQMTPEIEVATADRSLAFPDAVDRGLVAPATLAEIENLKTAWNDMERQYAELIKPFYEARSELLAEMRRVIPIGHHWQHPVTGIVFETEEPGGKMVTFEHYGVKRTALEGESSSGKLSKKRAVELGYKL